MATTYPVALDAWASEAGTTALSSSGTAGVSHAGIHTDVANAVEAIEKYVGTSATQVAPAGAGSVLRASSTSASAWSTATYPNTAAVSTILYASATNVISALATANSGVLITSASGVPSISSTIPSATQDNITRVGTLVAGNADGVVSAASLVLAGKVELATTAEINTGTDTTRAIPVDQYVASNRNVRYIIWRVIESATDWSADGTTKVGGDLEFPFTGTIVEIGGFVDTAGTTGTAIVDVNLGGTTIMTTNKLSFDSTEKTTRTAATAPALTTTAVTVGDIFTVDIDTNHTTKAKGLTIRLGIRLT